MKRKSGCGSWVVIIALLFAVTLGLDYVASRIDRARFPWGYADSGKPALAGIWVGPLTTGRGQRLGMLVEIGLEPLDRGGRRGRLFRTRHSAWFDGRVLVCARPGRVQHFRARGAPQDFSAPSPFHLALSPTDSVPPDGLAPSHLQGRWNGGDTLAFETSLYLRRGKSSITSSNDPDTGRETPVTLKRGTEAEFNSLCGRLS